MDNMAYTTIDNSELHFQTQLYTGNGSGGHGITFDGSENMQPDVVWIKQRDSRDHFLFNSVNGATKYVAPNTDALLETDTDTMTGFNADGFTLGSGVGCNENNDTHASYNWKMGTTSGITTGGASITPAGYSFNATAGFSIITWTGTGANATLPHGLSSAPGLVIIKNRDGGHWRVYHHKNTSAPETDFLRLDTTAATSDSPDPVSYTHLTLPTILLV